MMKILRYFAAVSIKFVIHKDWSACIPNYYGVYVRGMHALLKY
jgi:hypothetical protein